MRLILTKEALDFIAKYLGDLSKAILTICLASYFFEKMPLFLRLGLPVVAVVFLTISVIIIERF